MKKTEAIAAFKERVANQPEHINNASLYAGSPMYFYCRHCGHESDVLPESYTTRPKRECSGCLILINNGWLEEAKTENH